MLVMINGKYSFVDMNQKMLKLNAENNNVNSAIKSLKEITLTNVMLYLFIK